VTYAVQALPKLLLVVAAICSLTACGSGGSTSNSGQNADSSTPIPQPGQAPTGPAAVAAATPTTNSSGTIVYPVANQVPTILTGKTIMITVPGIGYRQATLNTDGTAVASDWATSGPVTGANTGKWTGNSGSITLSMPIPPPYPNSPTVYFGQGYQIIAADVINQSLISSSRSVIFLKSETQLAQA